MTMQSVSPSLSLKGSICPKTQSSTAPPTSFLFIVDMSLSNIGSGKDVNGYTYWDPSKATDAAGKRFDAINQVFTACSANNARYSVIGFSDGAGKVIGSGNSATWTTDCSNITFGDSASAKAVVDGLHAEQNIEAPYYDQFINNYVSRTDFPPIMLGTNYVAALKCADQIINKDLYDPASFATERYEVVFITDGAPWNEECQDDIACFKSKTNPLIADMRQTTLAMAKGLNLLTVFYGNSTASALPDILVTMSQNGNGGAPMQLDSFSNQQDAFCKLLNSQLSIAFQPDSFFTVNLTTVKKGGKLKSDSDMDGIPDDEEVALNFDPHNPRTVPGVLDGICKKLGGIAACTSLRDSTGCNQTQYKNYLSDCDIKLLQLTGVDTDGDSLMDFVEVVKGTNPAFSDALSDPDSDQKSNLNEIMQGSDLFTNDPDFPDPMKTKTIGVFNPSSTDCSDGGWDYNVTQTSVSPTEAVSFPSALQDLNHQDKEQVLWMGYRLIPKNSANSKVTYYGKIVNVQVSDDGLTQRATPAVIKDQDFVELGQESP